MLLCWVYVWAQPFLLTTGEQENLAVHATDPTTTATELMTSLNLLINGPTHVLFGSN